MRRIATTGAMVMALLMAPAAAQAAESVSVVYGVLTYVAGDGTVDDVSLSESAGLHYLSEPNTPDGAVGAGCTYIGSATAECTGATSALLQALDGNDTVDVTAALPTTIDGGDGTDTINGGPLADVIDGGAGPDTINAGDGDDTIEARDGEVDTIDCGPGDDPVLADAVDVLTNCEPVPPPEGPGPGEQPAPPVEEVAAPAEEVAPPVEATVQPTGAETPPALPLTLDPPSLLKPTVTLATPAVVAVGARGVATFQLTCAPTETAGCAGVVYLDPVRRKKGKPRALAARRGRYGHRKFTVAAGGKARLRVSLSRAARKKLGLGRSNKARAARRGRRVKAQVTVKQRSKKPVKRRVTLRS